MIAFTPSWGDEFLMPLIRRYGERFKLIRSDNPSVVAALEIIEKSNNIKFDFKCFEGKIILSFLG